MRRRKSGGFMLSLLAVAFQFCGFYSIAKAETIIEEGYISGNWSKSNQPYIINGHITLKAGDKLTIEPGVNVIFSNNYLLKAYGTLVAVGTASDSIRFTASDQTAGWGGIRFFGATNQDTSKLAYCILEYGKANISGSDYGKHGGAIYCTQHQKITISHCLIQKCTSYAEGGGFYAYGSAIRMSDTVIKENRAYTNHGLATGGGGISLQSCTGTLTNLVVTENHAGYYASWGGGILLSYSDILLEKVVIVGNHTYDDWNSMTGAGVFLWYSNPTIKDCIFANNIGPGSGGGLCSYQSNPVIFNSTFADNSASDGAAFTQQGGKGIWVNCVIWGNQPNQLQVSGWDYQIVYSDVQNGFDAEGNIWADPLFVDPANGDFQLQKSSPCIDNGTALWATGTDTLLNLAPDQYIGMAPDMGAFEYQAPNLPPHLISSTTVLAYEDQPFCYAAQALDPEGLPLKYSFADYPQWLAPNDSMLCGTPSEATIDTSFRVIASDGQYSDEIIVRVQVIPLNDAPEIIKIKDFSFAQYYVIDLDTCVIDPDNERAEMSWSIESSKPGLIVQVIKNIAFFGISDKFLAGVVKVSFKVTDPLGASDSLMINVAPNLMTGVDSAPTTVPTELTIHQNYPNPFNASTIITYGLPAAEHVGIALFNLNGQRLLTLYDGMQGAGTHSIKWDAENCAAGNYFIHLTAGRAKKIIKCSLVR